MNNFTQTIFTSSRNSFNKIVAVCSFLLICNLSFGQVDDFTDGNFSASPAWSGNTAAFTVETASPYLASGAATDGFYLASDITTGNVTLSTASTEVNEWKFSLGTGTFSPSSTNYFGVILMSNTAVTGSITGTSWNGYYLKIGVNGSTDPIELWFKNGAGTGTKVGDFPSSPNYDSAALLSGLNIRVTRSASGVFELFYSTGFTYSSTPTTSAGTLTNNTITTSSFFGVYSVFGSPSAARRLFLDNVVLGTPPVAITSAQSGNWSSTSTWVGGIVPSSASNVVIASGHVVTLDTATGGINTRNSGTTTTVDAGGTFATSVQYINNGTTTINGTFQLNAGGFTNSGNVFVYGSAGTLNFNNTSSYGVNNADQYWPTTSGPFNVTILQGGMTLNTGVNRTVAGTFQTAAAVTLTGVLTLTGTARINTGGSFANSPIYGNASTLIYNTGGTFGRASEWNATSGAVGTTAGYPNNVQISNNTTLNFPNGVALSPIFLANGTVTIDAGSSLYQNFSGGNAGLSAGSSVLVNGNMTLGTSSGDLILGGDLTVGSSANFSTNGRAVTFSGASGNQTITKTGIGTVAFDYLVVDKAAGNVVISSSPATDITVNATAGNVLQLINAGSLDLNGRTLTMNNSGGSIYVNGSRTITSGVSGGKLDITNYKLVANNAGTGSLTLASNVTVNLNTNGNFDFGKSGATYITTLNGILSINSTTSCFVNANPPIYGTGSLLKYNSGGVYGRGVEWSTTSGAGYPSDLQVSNNTTVDVPNTGGAFSTNLALSRNLTIDSGSSLYMDYGAGAASGSLTVGGNAVISGNLSLGDAIGGDMNVAGNWTRTGIFTPNSRLVTFNGTSAQTLTGATTFDFLTLNNTTGLTLQTSSAVTVNQTLTLTGKLTIGANNLTVSGALTGASSTNYVVTNSTGQLRRPVATTAVLFPTGNTVYNPITFTNSGASDTYGVRVANTAPAGINPTKTITRQWITTEAVAGGSNLAVVAQYNTGDTGAGYATSTDNFIGHYNGTAWTQVAATHAGSNPFTVSSNTNLSPSDMTTGTQYFAIGRDNAFLSVPNRYVITAITPASPTAGIGFSATVSAQDAYGTATTLSSNSSFSLTSNGNAGTIAGNVNGTISSGSSSVVVTGIILPTTGTGVILTATNSSGLALTAATSSSFNVLAAASQLAFVGVPATGNVSANLTSFTVEARRPDNSLDNTYTGLITLTKASGIGAISGTLSANAIAGVATFSTVQFDTADTYTLNANSGSLIQATSGTIVVTLTPVILYLHNFNTGATTSPYTVLPTSTTGTPTGVFNSLFTNVTSWVSSDGSFTNFGGNSGQAIVITPTNGTVSSMTLTLNIANGYQATLSSFNFWRQKTSNGPNISSITINGNQVLGANTSPTSGTFIGSTSVSNANNLTGTITVVINLTAPVGASQNFRLDEFTLNGNITCVQPVAYTVTGGGNGCANTGVAVGLSNSQIGVSYQLKNGAANVGSPVAGTGSAISFGNQTTAATYTVVASNTNGTCNYTLNMTGSVTVTLNPIPTLATISATPACAGSTSTVTLTGLLPSTNESFTYTNSYTGAFVYNVSGVSDSSGNFTFSTPALPLIANSAVITITSGTVTATGCTTTFSGKTVTVVVNPILTASVSIAATATTICSGTSVTFTATPTNGGSTPSYQWYVGATPVGTNSATYTSTTLANSDSVSVVMTSNASPCLTGSPATSNSISITVNPILTASVSIAATATTICAGTSVTFTATPTNGGSTPSYQWYVGATPVGTDSATYTSTTLANADSVSVVMTSNASPCLTGSPATSNSISITVNPILSASVSIAATATTICAGTSVTFTATPTNGGSTPSYQWYVGATPVGSDSATYSSSTLSNGNSVSVVMTSNASPCLTGSPATSNSISVTVNPILNASVSIAASATTICAGTSVTFTATPTNGGSTPSYQWYVGATPVGTDSATYSSSTLSNGNSVSVVMTSNASPCLTGSPATSNSISITVNPNSTYYQDLDGDGFGNSSVSQTTCSGIPVGYVTNSSDCNDNQLQYADLDADGFGSTTLVACGVTNNTDCNDNQVRYLDADGDGYGSVAMIKVACGGSLVATDCDDAKASINPGAVDVCYDAIDNDCNGNIDNVGLPGGCIPKIATLQTASCGSTVTALNTIVSATNVPGAQAWRFKVTNMTTLAVQTLDSPSISFQFMNLPGVTFGTQYQIEVAIKYAGVWQGFYGAPCFVNTPSPVSIISSAQCGSTLTSMSQYINSSSVANVTGYRYEVTNQRNGQTQYVYSSLNKFTLTQLLPSNQTYDTNYFIRVACRNTDGSYLPEGPGCIIKSRSFPTTQVVSSLCNNYLVPSMNTSITVDPVAGTTLYKFRLFNGTYDFVVESVYNRFTLGMFPGIDQGALYSVQVAVQLGGVFDLDELEQQKWGKTCTLTTPSAARQTETSTATPRLEVVVNNEFTALAYPNPFAANFKLNVTTNSEESLTVRVYDMLGKLVEDREVNATDVETLEVGANYPSGVYNVIVTQGENTKTLRVIKR